MDNARTIIEPIIQNGALENLEGTNVVPAQASLMLKSKSCKKPKNELKQ